MPPDVNDNKGKSTGQQIIGIPALYLYSKEVGDRIGSNRITTFVYEIRTSPNNSTILKVLL